MKVYNREFLMAQTEAVKASVLNMKEKPEDEEVLAIIEDAVLENAENMSAEEADYIIHKIYSTLRNRLGLLDMYINREDITEIMVNGKDMIFFENGQGMIRVDDSFDSTEELEDIIRNIAAGVHREINEMNPILDARLEDGSRVNAVYKNVAVNGPVLTIRKFAKERISIKQMIDGGTLSEECAEFLRILVESGYNIFVSGGTSSGKTTFLNALSDFIPEKSRVIVIEDSTELQLKEIENLIQMECHNANSLGQGQIAMDLLIKTSLRMRPDRIIVGEVRGKEIADMLQAMNTGHSGSMSTGHGNSVAGMLRRLEAMYLMSAQIPMDAIRAQIVEGIDIMVHLGRFERGARKVMEIQELLDFQDGRYILNPLFLLDKEGKLIKTENRLKNISKVNLRGLGNDRGL